MKAFIRTLAVALALVGAFGLIGCDSPRENAVEEKVEDQQEAAGKSEDAAEQAGEAAKDTGMTDTTATSTTGTTGTTATTTQTTVTTT